MSQPPFYRRPGFWNLPNAITVARIFAVPLMVWVLWDEPGRMEAILACGIFVTAMLTDVLDGYLARKWKLVSVAGAFLDPLADKLMVATTMVMMVALDWLPAWIAALIICRELTITALRTVALSEGLKLPADSLGKFKTAFQSTALGYLLWHYPTELWPGFTVSATSVGYILLLIAVAFTIISAFNYLWNFFKHAAEKERREGLRP
ncbi:MAG: CDP-diacylglycerol--glycerol-3-phosphate 3-phosphatidyltransferase [Myxococcota bacterium]|nr:CDP-diacylglycerol--glycerol-3-phosphate 3-phosphatidyltransferase [Myxococcota bacterium]